MGIGKAARPLHIGLFSPALPKSGVANGIVTYVRYMRDALREAGHRVSVIATPAYEDARGQLCPIAPPSSARYRLNRIGAIGRSDRRDILDTRLPVAAAIAFAHSRDPFDVLEIEESFGWAGHLKLSGAAVVARLHGPHFLGRDAIEADDARGRGDRRAVEEGRAIAGVAAISSPSARLLTATLDHYRLHPRIAEAIPNPIAADPPETLWSLDGCDRDQLLCVGRFDARKGADILLAAFARAVERRPALKLVLVGPDGGLPTATGERIHFAEHVRTNLAPSVAKCIRYLGNVSSEEIARLRRQSLLSVIASRFENFPYSLAEAMAAGTTSIVSDSFGNGEMVEQGRTGLVVPVADVDALADAIVALHSDPQRVAAMAAAAYARCRSWLAPDTVAQRTLALYKRAMG